MQLTSMTPPPLGRRLNARRGRAWPPRGRVGGRPPGLATGGAERERLRMGPPAGVALAACLATAGGNSDLEEGGGGRKESAGEGEERGVSLRAGCLPGAAAGRAA